VISDGPSGSTGGSLVKTGTGTLTLSGTNTYTGGTTFAGGTVSVSSDANLGDAAGSLTFNGGTLQITGTAFNTTARAVVMGAGSGTFDIANAANSFTVNQGLTGTGGLTKTGAGTLWLSGTNTYTGATTVSAGTLIIQDSIASSVVTNNATLVYTASSTASNAVITNNAQLIFDTYARAGNAVIINSGNVLFDGDSTPDNAQLINTASTAVINFFTPGLHSDGKISAGSIAGNGRFDLNGAELTVGGNNLSTAVTGVLAGDGSLTGTSLIKVGTGTLTLAGINTYTGATIVDDGALVVNGSIAASSAVTVNNGGILGGGGTVSSTTVNAGGTLAAGNGTANSSLSVAGSLALQSGALYMVQINPATSSFANVSGTATLGGSTLKAVYANGRGCRFGEQCLRACLRAQECHRHPQRARPAHGQILRHAERRTHPARPRRLGARLHSGSHRGRDVPGAAGRELRRQRRAAGSRLRAHHGLRGDEMAERLVGGRDVRGRVLQRHALIRRKGHGALCVVNSVIVRHGTRTRKFCNDGIVPVICPTCQMAPRNVRKPPCRQPAAPLHGVVFRFFACTVMRAGSGRRRDGDRRTVRPLTAPS
jgi:autotransporter-associated beta strand protein